ncbi:BREX-1 system adenine-specific DNA-methyltransferase PglX [Simplicispira suum]|uniref:BREX-1 system adenine-specific DNA-methyltransferase PglX n=1 Tax=Simplicispira suum TaxID=2109915 RepID=UPI002356C993|nr:BREX-1 system adenine-specific DNA-methyltransferase PglX [Simplicispira suum]
MAFDQATRNQLQRFVNDARRVLEEEFTRQLQNDYGMDPSAGTVAELANLRHINDAQRETARILRDTLAHYTASGDMNASQGLDRIVREQAFTVLNRLAALRMAESRGLLVESVGNGFQAKGFQLYARLAGTGLGETGDAYRVYLFSVFDELAQDLPGLFDRYSPQGRLFPREAALLQVLNLINDADIAPLWREDETIGWIYQYFNSKEERKAMREASQAPRNSRELAVRNQFFTPRYVVEFLVDNTLGRLWFNATGGATGLRERCQYLLVKPDETPQAVTKLRDPRTLKLLDPACGSMHFGLYAFDLFAEIYREAWAWEHQHGPGSLDVSTQPQAAFKPLSQTCEDEAAFLRDVPRLIIEHNIYGVDIDPRAAQIASLALWLRAQRAWHDDGVKAKDRPLIGRGHVVAATAPPAERELRQQFAANLDQRDAELFEKTLQLLKGLPELGVLLQVERELPRLIRQVYVGKGTGLFAQQEHESWQQAEARLRTALTEFAQAAKSTYQGRLFVQDAQQGLRLVDVCNETFDVVVMNPPFGETSQATQDYLNQTHPEWNGNILCAFLLRSRSLLRSTGLMAAIFDKTALIKSTYEAFRDVCVFEQPASSLLVDLGWGVLDGAQVETALSVWEHDALAARIFTLGSTPVDLKSNRLLDACSDRGDSSSPLPIHELDLESIKTFPNKSIPFDASDWIINLSSKRTRFVEQVGKAMVGCQIKSDVNFRMFWELPEHEAIGIGTTWSTMFNGGSFSPFVMPLREVVRFGRNGDAIPFHKSNHLTNIDSQQRAGFGWGKRGDLVDATVLPEGCVFTIEGQALPFEKGNFWPLAYLNSRPYWYLINQICGQHKYAGYVNACPTPVFATEDKDRLSRLATLIVNEVRPLLAYDETCREFVSPVTELNRSDFNEALISLLKKHHQTANIINAAYSEINEIVYSALGISKSDQTVIEEFTESVGTIAGSLGLERTHQEFELSFAKQLVSYAVGVGFGRWDASHGNKNPWLDEAGQQGLLPTKQLGRYIGSDRFVELAEGGAAVGRSLYAMVSACLEQIFLESSKSEERLSSALGVTRLEEYIESGGFFTDHFDAYRKCPIYWPLSTPSGNYTLWVYYPNLTSQTLYTAINDFVEPKLKQVGADVTALRNKGSARTRDDERQFESLQTFELELIELRDSLLKLAPTYKPNHEDGVQITAAPLWPLFRHKPWQKVLKDTWAKLEKGDYDWAHLAMNYWPERVREKCKTDKSLAIAHGLEHLYVEPEAQPKKTRGRKKAGGDE